MNYALNLAEDNRILSACEVKLFEVGIVIVGFLEWCHTVGIIKVVTVEFFNDNFAALICKSL